MLEAVAFFCGAVVMALEMTGSRLLAPVLGSSVLVWTALIGVILSFLSAGYWLGGRMADAGPSAAKLALLILAAAFCVLGIGVFHQGLLPWAAGFSERPEYGAVLGAALLFGPASLLLGMASPYAVRVALHIRKIPIEKTGAALGRFSAASAVGSILGTFAGGYYLIAWVGSRQSLYLLASVLMIVALIALLSQKITLRRSLLQLLLPVLGLALTAGLGLAQREREAAERAAGNFSLDTRYSHLQIQEGVLAGGRRLRILSTPPQLTQAAMLLEEPTALFLEYTRHFALAWQLRPQAKKFLMLGGAAYSVPKYLLRTRTDIEVDVVEIDQDMTALARELFHLRDDPRLRIFHEDARSFLNRLGPDSAYDVIMGDTFSSVYNIPFQMSTVECARRISGALAPDGIYIANVLSAVTGEKSYLLRSFRAGFEQVFPAVHVFPLHPETPSGVQNIMVLGLKNPDGLPGPEELERAGLNPALSGAPREAADEFALAYKMLRHEWRIILAEDLPPLYDDFAPVERYALPLAGE